MYLYAHVCAKTYHTYKYMYIHTYIMGRCMCFSIYCCRRSGPGQEGAVGALMNDGKGSAKGEALPIPIHSGVELELEKGVPKNRA